MHTPLHPLLAHELAADRMRERVADRRPDATSDPEPHPRGSRALAARTFAVPVVREIPSAREETRNRRRWA
jgi:hypothetical protein